MSEVAQRALVAYSTALVTNPLRTKMLTSGSLSALAEVLAGKLAGVAPAEKQLPPGQVSREKAAEQQPLRYVTAIFSAAGINRRAFEMFIYGFAISAPLGHVMTGAFRGGRALRTEDKRCPKVMRSADLCYLCRGAATRIRWKDDHARQDQTGACGSTFATRAS